MNTKKLFSAFIGLAVAGSLFTSCIKNEPQDTEYRLSFNKLITTIYSGNDALPKYTYDVAYSVDYNYTKLTANLTIGALSIGSTAYTTLSFDKSPWTIDNIGWKKIHLTMATPTSSAATLLFDEVVFDELDRVNIDQQISYFPLTNIHYSIGTGLHTVNSIMPMVLNIGKTNVSAEGASPFTTEETIYIIAMSMDNTVDLNKEENRKASIRLKNARFASSMPAMNLSFENVPFNIDRQGRVQLKAEGDIIPNMITFDSNGLNIASSTPNENFPISNLQGFTDGANNMTLSFTCTIKGVPYQVLASCVTPTATATN